MSNGKKESAAERQARRAKALRANLKRRKAQVRERVSDAPAKKGPAQKKAGHDKD